MKSKDKIKPELKESGLLRRLMAGLKVTENERQQAESHLQLLEAILRLTRESVVTTDLEYNITYWSKVSEKLYGIRADEALGKKLFDVIEIVESTPLSNAERFKKLESPENIQQEHLCKTKCAEVWVNMRLHPLEDGTKPSGWVVIASDITQRKRVEHLLDERISELRCLYGITTVAEKPGITLDEIYQEVANTLPVTWHYPRITCARILINGKEFRSSKYEETKLKQSGDIVVHGKTAGRLEVCYPENRAELEEGPFPEQVRLLIDLLVDAVALLLGNMSERKQMEAERQQLITELQKALANVEILSGLLPICAWCKKIRSDEGYWQAVEQYLSERSRARFTHSICPECLKKQLEA